MFPRSLESDSQAFCKKAMEKDLMLVRGHLRLPGSLPYRVLCTNGEGGEGTSDI